MIDALALDVQRSRLIGQHRQHDRGETHRAVAAGFAAGGVGFFRRYTLLSGQLRHRQQLFDQCGFMLVIVRQHTDPQINPDGVVTADIRFHGIRLPAFAGLPHHPIRGETVRCGFQQQPLIGFLHRSPWAVQGGKTRQQLRRQVAWIEPPAILRHEPDLARQQHQPQPGDVGHFFAADTLQQQRPQSLITPAFPQTTGFQQIVGNPQIGIGRRIRVQHRPAFFIVLAPQPGGQMGAEIARRQVVFRPLQQLVERRPIVRHQGEEQAVALPLRGGDAVRAARVDHPSFVADVKLFVLLPGRPLAGRRRAECTQQQHAERQAFQRCRHGD
ncbi:hypothetical protein D3C81_381010 [compost metagenome]